MANGKLIISLDFELFWGVRDVKTKEQYGENVLGVHKIIPRLLKTFKQYNIRATFATVGFLFFESKKELIQNIPSTIPTYQTSDLSPYKGYFDLIGENFEKDLYHYAPQLINLIKEFPEQEIGTHTFSHYYCLEKGQTKMEFNEDLKAAIFIAEQKNIKITSLVFPRNQFNNEYLQICKELGIICYRGNPHYWLYSAIGEKQSSLRRGLKLVDAYLNLSGHNCYTEEYIKSKFPMDIPASRFLRPYSKSLKLLDRLRLNRIKSGMTYAAKNNMIYHLWWHPHNFGINQNENFQFLEKILHYYDELNRKYNFQSITMSELAQRI